jgi:signal transduction histidine kinase
MPSQAALPFADEANVTIANMRRPLSADARSRAAAKGVATLQRHARERRADSLARIRAQIADGTLVVRQMTTAERKAAPGDARPTPDGRPTPDARLTPALAPARVVLGAREQERLRIADGVHDDSLQAVFAVGLGLANLQHRVQDQETSDSLKRLQETVRTASQRLRSLVFELHPPELESQGLVPALRAYLEHAEREEGLEFALDGQLSATLEPELCTFLYRAAQEILVNVRKHAHASRVNVWLAECGGRHVIRVHDDGVGFDAFEALRPRSGHLGLAALSERLELAGGVLRIDSAAGAGTTVEFEVPVVGGRRVSNRRDACPAESHA